jgi:hypothetical protein
LQQYAVCPRYVEQAAFPLERTVDPERHEVRHWLVVPSELTFGQTEAINVGVGVMVGFIVGVGVGVAFIVGVGFEFDLEVGEGVGMDWHKDPVFTI